MNIKNIGIFGKRNVGKSSFINILVGQNIAIVSSIAGTTNDPVKKRIELPGIGPCNLIDTAGIDDVGDLGELRVGKSLKIIEEIDMAIVLYAANNFGTEEKDLMKRLKDKEVPVLIVHNQSDIFELDIDKAKCIEDEYGVQIIEFSCCRLDSGEQMKEISEIDDAIVRIANNIPDKKTIMSGLIKRGKKYILVCPIDTEAPKERLILPQVMAIRDILDNNGIAIVLQPQELSEYLKKEINDMAATVQQPQNTSNDEIGMIITDSSIFKEVSAIIDTVSDETGNCKTYLPLTSFSILLSRMKCPFEEFIRGAEEIDKLKKGCDVLILESCTHHVTCNDIGRVKIPKMLPEGIKFSFVQGLDPIPDDIKYDLAIQCGGCMVTDRQLKNRVNQLINRGIKVTNYGMAIAKISGVLDRCIKGL